MKTSPCLWFILFSLIWFETTAIFLFYYIYIYIPVWRVIWARNIQASRVATDISRYLCSLRQVYWILDFYFYFFGPWSFKPLEGLDSFSSGRMALFKDFWKDYNLKCKEVATQSSAFPHWTQISSLNPPWWQVLKAMLFANLWYQFYMVPSKNF